jgi:hypothetical protein
MSYWDILPPDLQNYIINIAGTQIIQKEWKKYRICKKNALKIAKKILKNARTQYSGLYIDCFIPENVINVEYCAKYVGKNHCITDKNTNKIWIKLLNSIEYSLYSDYGCIFTLTEQMIYQRMNKAHRILSISLRHLNNIDPLYSR